jgi:hypothetical protein
VPEKNAQLVELAERADRRMEKCRKSRVPLSLADLEFMKNDVHEAVELGHKARFLWLSADERADNLGRALFDARAELARDREELRAEIEREVRAEIADDIHRAELPTFAASENPELVAKVVRAVDVRLASDGPTAPYGVVKGGQR